jgi:hypothetical protein
VVDVVDVVAGQEILAQLLYAGVLILMAEPGD